MAEQSTLEYIISGTCDTGVLYGNVLLYSDGKDYMMADGRQIGGGLFLKRPFAQWRHFATDTRMLQCLAFLCKLGLLLF